MADRIVVMNEARIQQVADPLTIATKPATELVARFMGDNNLISGKVTQSENGRVVIEDEHGVQVSIRPGATTAPAVGEPALVSIRAAAVEVGEPSEGAAELNSARCEIVFVEFLGDLIKLHLTAGGERMLAKVSGDRYPAFRGKEGETVLISWKEEDVQLLDS
jgi:putative spermidine/putrescine transport system ATP-binding protein